MQLKIQVIARVLARSNLQEVLIVYCKQTLEIASAGQEPSLAKTGYFYLFALGIAVEIFFWPWVSAKKNWNGKPDPGWFSPG
jgi:hypothetical protein